MLEPQGTLFFLLLLIVFGGLVAWLALTRHVAFRVVAACLAFIPAMVFGIAAVNKYYDYYQSWGALFSDLSGQVGSAPQAPATGTMAESAASLKDWIAKSSNLSLDAQYGFTLSVMIPGPTSHIDRPAYIFLPPQYFSKAYANYRFPAIELLHGSPGEPSSWINVLNVLPIFLGLLNAHKAQPAVLVMPNTDGGLQYGLQCLNDPHGIQDMTYVGREVQDWVSSVLRVQSDGQAWGIAGYSEGGFCAANIGLQYPARYGAVGVLSGYFAPILSRVPVNGVPRNVNVYAHNHAMEMRNSPDVYINRIPNRVDIPRYFLAAGARDSGDVSNAMYFKQELGLRDPNVPLDIVPGGGHQAVVWRAALTPMFSWMTPKLAQAAQAEERAVRIHENRLRHAHRSPVVA